jgi:hypothetical protein
MSLSPREVAASYRLYAAYCGEVARDALDAGRKVALLNMAQAWAKLAERVENKSETDGPDVTPYSEH